MQPLINPDYVRGITDGEGCFTINIRQWAKNKTGFSVSLCFCISLVKKDDYILEFIRDILACGTIVRKHKRKGNHQAQVQFHVTNMKDIKEKVVPFFEAHPLIIKDDMFRLWKRAIVMINSKRHLSRDGLLEIAFLRDNMNRKKLKKFTYEELQKLAK
jgi:hypothetical protein